MKRFLLSAMFALTLTACSGKDGAAKKTEDAPEQPARVLDYLSLTSDYLLKQQNKNGFFSYEFDFITGKPTGWDNLIHQTRTAFSLMQYYAFMVASSIDPPKAETVLSAVRNSLNAFGKASVLHNDMPGMLVSFYYSPKASSVRSSDDFLRDRLSVEIAATSFALTTELYYWGMTDDNRFEEYRLKWRKALLHHTEKFIQSGGMDNDFPSAAWLALTTYAQSDPSDTEVVRTAERLTGLMLNIKRPVKTAEDYTWDMMAVRQNNIENGKNEKQKDFVARQTSAVLDLYPRHDASVNSCLLSLGLATASNYLTDDPSQTAESKRLGRAALGRGQLEYYSSLKFTILPRQTWISLGPGRTLHSQDFRLFTGASVAGLHMPQINIGLAGNCLLAGMRFAGEDIKENAARENQ